MRGLKYTRISRRYVMAKRKFSNDYKREAVKLVLEQGLPVAEVARDLGVHETTLHGWVRKERDGILDPSSPKSQELDELKRLRKENAVLKREREILKKAAAFFARENN
jgi:transposase